MKAQTASGHFQKILIANRGEIACRIIRTCQNLGVSTVAVYSEADQDALHVRLADDAFHIGKATPEDSYLNHERILETVVQCQADAIHPGYGFLSENPNLPELCNKNGNAFIGPRAETIHALGNKASAREIAIEAGVPVIPATKILADDMSKIKQQASEISEDELRRIEDLIQKETDKYISIVDSELKNKESDLLEI